jgi:4'-phosphopantetheinyl transferase
VPTTTLPSSPSRHAGGGQATAAGLEAACRGLVRDEGLAAGIAFHAIGTGLPPTEAPPWLGPGEQLVFDRLALPKRRRDWLAGRFAARRAVAQLARRGVTPPVGRIEVMASESGAPGVLVAGSPSPLRVSIAHAGEVAGAIAWQGTGVALGLDLEPLALPDRVLDRVAFTPEESAWARGRGTVAERALCLWTAKEAALKAVEIGLRADLRQVVVTPAATGAPWDVRYRGDSFRVRHAISDGYVAAIAVRRGSR